ncbi:MAG: 50S ribosomal protein L29 [Desulfococcus sp.]|nr:MAG: 50S ribosomal protein L29 [Desulfococcus sp.]
MKAKELREFGVEELQLKEKELTEDLFNLRFQQGTGQLENPRRMQAVKRDIARVKTLIRETRGTRVKPLIRIPGNQR